jgi:hypothetical protein
VVEVDRDEAMIAAAANRWPSGQPSAARITTVVAT